MRTIDGDALLKSQEVSWVYQYDETGEYIKYKAIPVEAIEKAPTLDLAPVVHGEWIEQEITPGDVYYTCSVCKEDWFIPDGTPAENFMHYCPRCGAKMDEGER